MYMYMGYFAYLLSTLSILCIVRACVCVRACVLVPAFVFHETCSAYLNIFQALMYRLMTFQDALSYFHCKSVANCERKCG